jgi:hypothetical protein
MLAEQPGRLLEEPVFLREKQWWSVNALQAFSFRYKSNTHFRELGHTLGTVDIVAVL